jgi:hypothetical protein
MGQEHGARDSLAAQDEALLKECDLEVYRSSGPGGQHRNKTSTAVRLTHRPTGVTGHGDESRSQQDNRRMAVRRLRMNIACRVRRPVDLRSGKAPAVVAGCLFVPKKAVQDRQRKEGEGGQVKQRLEVGVKDHRFWPVAAWVLDVLEAAGGAVSDAAKFLGITTGNLVSLLKSERHLLAAASQMRKNHGLGPLK